ncbi:MAG TPA: CHASE domain-containing protein [Longimicrobium sp.]
MTPTAAALPSPPTAPPRRRSRVPYVVLAVSLLATLAATLAAAGFTRARDQARFENAVQSTRDRIQDRLDTYVALLRGGAALFDASGEVTRDEFRAYVGRLRLRERYPGVQGIGYTLRLAPGRAAAVEAAARADGLADFRVWPGTRAPERHTILYLEPLDERNRAALGFDMSSDPVRREAMERARDRGMSTLSGRVTLKQEIESAEQAGFLIYTPVYRGGGVPATVAERRAWLEGFVYAPFRAADLFAGVFGSERQPRVTFQVYDGAAVRPAALLYDSRGELPPERRPAFTAVERIEVAGRRLTLAFQSRPAFEAGLNRVFVPGIAAAGLALSLLLFGIGRAQVNARATAELRAEALRVALAERERLVSIVESSSDLIGFASPEGEVLYLNRAGRRLLGLAPGAGAGKRVADFFAPGEAARLEGEILPAVRAGGRWQGETRFRALETGDEVPVQFTLFTIPDPQTGETIGLGTVTRDVTPELRARGEIEAARGVAERTAAQARELAARLKAQALELETRVEQTQALNLELQRANRAKASFLATMSHELRTPLNAVLGYSDLLLAGIPEELSEATRRPVERIALASRHLLSVIEEILSYARIEAGRETVELEEVALDDVLREVVAIVEPLAAGKRLAFRAPERVEPERLVTDARKLRQVLVNLLGNAVKFTQAGEIGFQVCEADGWVEFRVRDTGIGIAPDDLERIFEPFRQVDDATTRVAGGTGLGLAVSRHLARMMGGDVEVISALGEGSVFTLRLPLRVPAGAMAGAGGDGGSVGAGRG